MSQINDALRRAGHSAKAAPAGPPMPPPMPVHAPSSAPPPPPPPVLSAPALPPMPNFGELEGGESATRKSSGMQILLAVLLVLCVGGAAVVTFWEKRNRLSNKAKPTAEAGSKKMLSEEALNKTVAARQPVPVTPSNAGSSNIPKAVTAAPVVVAAPVTPSRPVEPVKFPPLRLQSIFYRPSNPSVMINSKTLFVDDMIQGVQVADIQPSSVTLVLSGQTNILTLR